MEGFSAGDFNEHMMQISVALASLDATNKTVDSEGRQALDANVCLAGFTGCLSSH